MAAVTNGWCGTNQLGISQKNAIHGFGVVRKLAGEPINVSLADCSKSSSAYAFVRLGLLIRDPTGAGLNAVASKVGKRRVPTARLRDGVDFATMDKSCRHAGAEASNTTSGHPVRKHEAGTDRSWGREENLPELSCGCLILRAGCGSDV